MATKQAAEPHHPERVEELLHDAGVKHVRARKYGASVIVESCPTRDPFKHFRIRRDTVHLWCLDMANHRGQWERTPFRKNLDELVLMVIENFPWTLTFIA
jgi:hypothetical protein